MVWGTMGESGWQSSAQECSKKSVLVMRARRLAAWMVLDAADQDKAEEFRDDIYFFGVIRWPSGRFVGGLRLVPTV